MDNRGIPLPIIRWRGLTIQLFLFTVLPQTALLLLISFGSLALHHNSMRELVGDRDLRAVRSAANSLASTIQSRGASLQILAESLENRPIPLDESRLPGFENGLALVAADGKLLSGSIAGVADPAAHLPAGGAGVVFSNPVRGQAGEWLVLAAAPTPGGSRLIGAIRVDELARQALSGITSEVNTVLLLSGQGEVLYQWGEFNPARPVGQYPGVAEVLRGESGVNYSEGENHQRHNTGEHLVAFSPVPPLGWGLVLDESWEAIASPLLRATQSAPLILVPVLLMALFALWFGARQIIQPLQHLEQLANRLAGGDFAAIQRPVGGISEIRSLQGALGETARALEQAQEALHGYIGALTAGVETERRSLARELHDDTLQALIALNQQVQLAALRAGNESQRQPLAELQERIGQTITNLRRAIGGLRPIYLEDLGLGAALGMLVHEMRQRQAAAEVVAGPPSAHRFPFEEPEDGETPGGPRIEFHVQGQERRLPAEVEMAFYRIAQEALNNAVHHAGPTHVSAELVFTAGSTQLVVADDGTGFSVPNDSNAFARQGHYGLLGMRERAELVGARFELVSAPGRGTRVAVSWAEKETGEIPSLEMPG